MNNLNTIAVGQLRRIHHVHAPTSLSEIALYLQQLGFLPGEQVIVQRRAKPGNDPIVVRVGTSTFAIRKFEAACIKVETQDD